MNLPSPRAAALFLLALVHRLLTVAFPPRAALPTYVGPLSLAFLVKDGGVEASLAMLTRELTDTTAEMVKTKTALETQYRELTTHFSGVKNDSAEIRAKVDEQAKVYADLSEKHSRLIETVNALKKELDAPIFTGGSVLADHDRKASIELARAKFLYEGGDELDFVVNEKELVDVSAYRSALRKMMRVGIETKANVIRSFNDAERKAFEASSMDAAFFIPEVLGIEQDCNVLCSQIVDLYQPVNVSRSNFMFPRVLDYGAIGSYECDAKCDAELGPAGNITWEQGKTFDWRGAFCMQKKTLQEANYDLLGFMMRSIMRSYGINRNRSLIVGDGVNEPLGWLTADCFTKNQTAGLKFNHVDFRRFLSSCPVEYGEVTATMHQNVFAYLASATDSEGRFIFGDGMMTYSPDDVTDRIRISNCLPDPTNGGTLGSAAAPFVAGSFIAAAGNWRTAFASVSKRPVFVEQYVGGSSAWCSKYQFGAEDGGFTQCCAAARTLYVGP